MNVSDIVNVSHVMSGSNSITIDTIVDYNVYSVYTIAYYVYMSNLSYPTICYNMYIHCVCIVFLNFYQLWYSKYVRCQCPCTRNLATLHPRKTSRLKEKPA